MSRIELVGKMPKNVFLRQGGLKLPTVPTNEGLINRQN